MGYNASTYQYVVGIRENCLVRGKMTEVLFCSGQRGKTWRS